MKTMTKRHIRTLAALMAIALLGLMSVQVYWIDSSIHVKEERFKQDVTDAMVSVARTLEEAEYAAAIAANMAELRKSAATKQQAETAVASQESSITPRPRPARNLTASVTASAVTQHPRTSAHDYSTYLPAEPSDETDAFSDNNDTPEKAELSLRFVDSTGGIKIVGDVGNLDLLLRDSALRLQLNKLGIEKADINKGLQKIEREQARRKIEQNQSRRRKKTDSTSASRRRQIPTTLGEGMSYSFSSQNAVSQTSPQSRRLFTNVGYSPTSTNAYISSANRYAVRVSGADVAPVAMPPTPPVPPQKVILRSLGVTTSTPVVVLQGNDAEFCRDSLVIGLKRNKNAMVQKIMLKMGEEQEKQEIHTAVANNATAAIQFQTIGYGGNGGGRNDNGLHQRSETHNIYWTMPEEDDADYESPKAVKKVKPAPKPSVRKNIVNKETVAQKVVSKVEQLSEVAAKMVCEIDAPREFQQRVAPRKLDSLIHKAMLNKGIATNYEYAVMLENSDSVIYCGSPKPNVALLKSGFTTSLFPNDIMPKHFSLKVYFPREHSYIFESLWAMLVSSGIFVAAIIGTFLFTLNSLWKQKRLSDMKTDFINNMTHEFQTPIATISLATEALKSGSTVEEAKRLRFLDIIFNENKRLGKHVEQILHAAAYDDGRFSIHATEVNLNHTVLTAVQNIAVQVENRGGNIFCKLDAVQPVVLADNQHIANIIRNLLDNACKYSPDKPHITISTRNNEKGVVVTVADEGIGMTKEQQKRVFEKFYRVPTGNRHDVKGFGLGLSYVKTMAEAHGGCVSVESDVGVGSRFEIFLPYSI